jgi:hypothetical protein
MLAKCANVSCSQPFRYLREGKLFRLDPIRFNGRGSFPHKEWFWLCGECATKFTLRVESGEVVAAPMPRPPESNEGVAGSREA